MIDSMPLVSVALATYNGSKYLADQIESILNQTYNNIELIVCDDASTDDTLLILNEFAKEDKRIKIYSNTLNLGFKKNFEKLISLCSGEYIAFSDQDDVWHPDKVKLSISKISNYDFVCGNANIVNGDLRPMNTTLKDTLGIYYLPKSKKRWFRFLISKNIVQGATIFAKKEFLVKNLPIPEDFKFHDWYFTLCSLLNNGFFYIDEPLLEYRNHLSNVTSNLKDSFFIRLKKIFFIDYECANANLRMITAIKNTGKFDVFQDDINEFEFFYKNYYKARSIPYYIKLYDDICFDTRKCKKVERIIKYTFKSIFRWF